MLIGPAPESRIDGAKIHDLHARGFLIKDVQASSEAYASDDTDQRKLLVQAGRGNPTRRWSGRRMLSGGYASGRGVSICARGTPTAFGDSHPNP